MTQKCIRTAILISGGGSNMEALIKASQQNNHPAEIILVISNRQDAVGLKKATKLGVDAIAIDHKKFDSRKQFEQVMQRVLEDYDTELVCNAGFMRILTPWFVEQWDGRQLNIHPSILPKFKGLHTHARAIEAGEKEHGCTVHFVNEGMDDGEIIDQARVQILEHDTPETLAARVLEQEHILYPKVLKRIATNMLEQYK